MECPVRICRELVYLFEYRELLRFEGIATCAEQVERLTVTEEYSLLAFVDDKL